jgi:hypothetical protein
MAVTTLTFTADEAALLAELRARLGLDTDADVIRVALFVYLRWQGLNIPPSMFAVRKGRTRCQATSPSPRPAC